MAQGASVGTITMVFIGDKKKTRISNLTKKARASFLTCHFFSDVQCHIFEKSSVNIVEIANAGLKVPKRNTAI